MNKKTANFHKRFQNNKYDLRIAYEDYFGAIKAIEKSIFDQQTITKTIIPQSS